jgi:stage II sporulation protein P
MDKLKDFNYLLSKFYTVDSTTTIGADQLNVDDFMNRNMKINTITDGPKVLIFHTHSQEAFADSASGVQNESIVGMGKLLAEILNRKGIQTIHHDGIYDLINGKLDRSKAYEMSEAGVKEILNQYPSIEVVIDLHRDGVPETTHLVTNINGNECAKIMFFNGLSRTKSQGNIAYLPNPYIQDNLAFSFQMQLASEKLYPGLARRIYLKGYRYSLHMMPKSLLIEAGAQTNTVQEMKNTMELLANILSEVLL